MNTRINQLNKLAGSIPVVNNNIAQGMQAARTTQLQQAIASMAPQQAGTTQAAQQLGAQQAQMSGAIQVQTAQKNSQQLAQVGQMALQEDRMQKNQELFTRQQALTQRNRALTNQLAQLDSNLKDNLLDQQLSFKQDEFGRTIWNERQLADFAVLQAKTQADLDKFEQTISQQSQRRLQILQTVQAKLKQALEQNYMREGQELDQQTRLYIANLKKQAAEKERRERAKRANRGAMIQGAFTIIGAGAGAYLGMGTPIGAAAGAAIGSQVGSGLGQVVQGTEGA
jgi:hypothetical protein